MLDKNNKVHAPSLNLFASSISLFLCFKILKYNDTPTVEVNVRLPGT
jgi:hypothetical protein